MSAPGSSAASSAWSRTSSAFALPSGQSADSHSNSESASDAEESTSFSRNTDGPPDTLSPLLQLSWAAFAVASSVRASTLEKSVMLMNNMPTLLEDRTTWLKLPELHEALEDFRKHFVKSLDETDFLTDAFHRYVPILRVPFLQAGRRSRLVTEKEWGEFDLPVRFAYLRHLSAMQFALTSNREPVLEDVFFHLGVFVGTKQGLVARVRQAIEDYLEERRAMSTRPHVTSATIHDQSTKIVTGGGHYHAGNGNILASVHMVNSTSQNRVQASGNMAVGSGLQVSAAAGQHVSAAAGDKASATSDVSLFDSTGFLQIDDMKVQRCIDKSLLKVPPVRSTATKIAIQDEIDVRREHSPIGTFQQALLGVHDSKTALSTLEIQQCFQMAKSVVVIHVTKVVGNRARVSYGTGSIVSLNPQMVLMTNHHVLPSAVMCSRTKIYFNHTHRTFKTPSNACPVFELDAATFFVTDFSKDVTFVAVKPNASQRSSEATEWLKANPIIPIPLVADADGHRLCDKSVYRLCIIQHPRGRPQEIGFCRDLTRIPIANKPWQLAYMVDTECGSSGSPVFNADLELMAIHSSATPKWKDDNPNSKQAKLKDGTFAPADNVFGPSANISPEAVDWDFNCGTLISVIYEWLEGLLKTCKTENDRIRYSFMYHILAGDPFRALVLDLQPTESAFQDQQMSQVVADRQ